MSALSTIDERTPTRTPPLRPEAAALADSGIIEVANYGRDRQGLIPLWVGEGDAPTPPFIRHAAAASLEAGETFYTHQRGIPELRDAIARYIERVYELPPGRVAAERFHVTAGGMHALQIAVRMAAGSGDEVLLPTPAWPNFSGALTVSGAMPVEIAMELVGPRPDLGEARWTLDLDRLAAAVGPRTRAIVINTPANPTGWTATPEELVAVLDLARRHGLWLIADEIYGRVVYEGVRAPSFRDIMDNRDRILFVQTMSKNWAMTGWRVGWLETPPDLGGLVENLIQYSTSGIPVFLQRAAVAALEQGENFVAEQLDRFRASRDIICDGLAATGKVRFARPQSAFYLFFGLAGEADTRQVALRLVDEAGVGLAPGSTFGQGGSGYLRVCFARDPRNIAEATRRIATWLRDHT